MLWCKLKSCTFCDLANPRAFVACVTCVLQCVYQPLGTTVSSFQKYHCRSNFQTSILKLDPTETTRWVKCENVALTVAVDCSSYIRVQYRQQYAILSLKKYTLLFLIIEKTLLFLFYATLFFCYQKANYVFIMFDKTYHVRSHLVDQQLATSPGTSPQLQAHWVITDAKSWPPATQWLDTAVYELQVSTEWAA